MSKEQTKLLTYDELPKGINIKSIVVGSEQDKEQLLLAIKYLHDLRNINTGFAAVNELVHLYHVPECITVSDDDIWHDNVVICRKFTREQLLPLFKPDSWFMKKVLNGPFYGEFGQPIKEPGMTTGGWTSRLIRVDMNKVCVLIKDIHINSKSELVGKIKFIGPLKEDLERTLSSNEITFGVRALVENQNEKDSKILDITAFDVIEYE